MLALVFFPGPIKQLYSPAQKMPFLGHSAERRKNSEKFKRVALAFPSAPSVAFIETVVDVSI
jgi:hypothetical protein